MQGSKQLYRNRFFKILLVITTVIIVGFVGLHLWFKHNARTILKEYIAKQSGGKIKLELSELDLNIFINRLQVHEADLVSTDTLNEPITYHVTFRKLSLRVASVWSLLFKKELLLDSIKLHDPIIEVIQWRKDTVQVHVKDELSIPQEMGKVYHSLLGALNEFGIRRITIDNAMFRLINKTKPALEPVTVSKIFFDLDQKSPANQSKGAFSKNGQTLELRTTHQNIALPGGQHRLSFKSFKLQLLRQRIELDSCTVTKIPTDSSKSNYRIYFKKLFLSGVDFAAMSAQNVIKADSVYCENPYFNFDIYKSVVKKKTEIPDAQKIVRELSGNLDLAFVGIKNAGIHIDVHGKTKRSFVNANKDNFEMTGFRINPDSSSPVAIGNFRMTLRDYHLFNEDSSSVFAFDSLLLLNDKIALNNFSINSQSGLKKLRNELNIKVPFFQLTELDWYQLIFDQNVAAKEAVLENPVIVFKRNINVSRGKKVNLFDALETIDSLVALNKVSVRNGQMNMQLGSGTSFNVQNLDFNLQSNKLLGSTNRAGLRSAVEYLSFSKGVLRVKDITAQLQNARYSANNQVYADKVSILSTNNSIAGTVNNVHIDNLLLDDAAETIELDGLEWTSASIALKALPATGNGAKNSVHLRNIAGNNTALTFSNGPAAISTFIRTINAASFIKTQNDPLVVEGFLMIGNELLIRNKTLKISGDSYGIVSKEASHLLGMKVEQIKGRDSLHIESPDIKFSADLNKIFANDIHLTSLHAVEPVITISDRDSVVLKDSVNQIIDIRIDNLTTTNPEIYIAIHRNDSLSLISIPSSENSVVNATGIVLDSGGMRLETLLVNTSAATYTKSTGEKLGIEKGRIELDISKAFFGKQDGKKSWNGRVNNFFVQDAGGLGMGKLARNLSFKEASFGNLSLSSGYFQDIGQLIKANVSAWLRIPAGEYIDSNTTFKWFNANYSNSNHTLKLDSLVYHPTSPLDSVLAYAPYQLDYITVKTGAITINGLDAAKYEKDSSFIADSIVIIKPVMTVYKDKFPPSSPNKKDKPLPVDIIRNIPLPVSVKHIQVEEGTITYGEKNATSRKEGTLLLSKLYGVIENIKNRNLDDYDSLSLTLNGYLMDSARLSISLKESYKDSLSAFVLKVNVKPTPLSILNPVIVPLANVMITSGKLDSLSLYAIGRNDVALGEMKANYHDLRIKLVKDGNPRHSTFMQEVISFLANTFLVKNNNTNRTGIVYFKKLPTQSFTNYIIKMTLSGMASSVGLKKNRTYLKEYNRQMQQSGLPAVKFSPENNRSERL